MPDLSNVTEDAARKLIDRQLHATYAEALALHDGDHWRDGEGWIGTQLQTDDPTEASRARELIERAFLSANKLRRVVGRLVAGVVGNEPDWSFTVRRPLQEGEEPDAAEQGLIDEAEAAMTTWWDRVLTGSPDEEGTVLEQVARLANLGRQALLRLYVPVDAQVVDVDTGRPAGVPVAPLEQQLARIHLEAIPPDRGTLVRDRRSGQLVAVVDVPPDTDLFADDDGKAAGTIEVHTVDPLGRTVVLALGEDGDGPPPLELGGRLLVSAVTVAPLVTPQLIQLQKAINHALTTLVHNTDLAGSPERWIWNAMRPDVTFDPETGRWSPTGDGLSVGAGVTNYAQGLPLYDEEGRITGYTSPSGQRFDPVNPDTLIATGRAHYEEMLDEAGQRHALIAGDATASGESRKQARAEFTESMRPTARAIEGALRSTLEAALALAATFAGQPGRYDGLRAVVNCRLEAGPLTSDERAQVIAQYEADLLDDEGAMAALGVTDVDAVKAKIAEAKAERAARAPQLAPNPNAPTTTTTTDQRPVVGQPVTDEEDDEDEEVTA